MNVLVTGGAGYIGSHTIIELVSAGHGVVVADNFSNSSPVAIERVSEIVGSNIESHEIDLCNKAALQKLFKDRQFDAVIHFAGLKAVGESTIKPLNYYHVNLVSSLNLLELMQEYAVKKLVFSSSATVYGEPASVPIAETAGVRATNPYGQTKLIVEQMLKDLVAANPEFSAICLRYFNPIGAHSSGKIGEDPRGTPNNLLPFVTQVASGKRAKLKIFSNDYDTPDGTGIRDYIHVTDLAKGHLAALEHIEKGWQAINLGTGHGYSVLEVIEAFSEATGCKIPYEITGRRPGDIAVCYADVSKANKVLGWKATKTLQHACQDAWRWQSQNPNGYQG